MILEMFDDFGKIPKGATITSEVETNTENYVRKETRWVLNGSAGITIETNMKFKSKNELESLNEMLQEAISNQEYEKAAVIRDRIKAIDNKE